jgi:hypothetical protein
MTDVIIPAGQSVSSAVDLTKSSLVMIMSPAEWDSANISFLVSIDGSNFVDLFDTNGTEIVRSMGPGRGLLVPAALTSAAFFPTEFFLKIRSGVRGNPIPQTQERVLTLALSKNGETPSPSNQIHNWGVVDANTNGVTVTFDQPYLSGPPSVTIADTSTTHSRITAVTQTDFTINGQGDVYWHAIGT